MFSIGALRRFKRLVDYAEYGGAPMLGLTGSVIVCHGASNEKAIKNAVDMAATSVRNNTSALMAQRLSENCDLTRYSRRQAGDCA
jgi:glycerol-3-phosphate acyltransferase PlsX